MKSVLLASALGALTLGGCGGGSGGGGPPPITHLFFSQDGNGNGLFEINTATGVATLVGAGASAVTGTTVGLTETPSPFVLIGSTFNQIANVASDGSGAFAIAGSISAEGLAMNINSGYLIGAFNTAVSHIHPVTGLSLGSLAVAPADVEGLAFDPTINVVYGIGGGNTNLFAYDVGTNTWSTVGSTGVAFNDCGLAMDYLNGILYAVDPATDVLYRINPLTAATVVVGALGTNGGGGLAFVVD